MIAIFQWFVRITGWIVQWFAFRTKIYYENKSVQSRKIKGSAIIVSNHTSVYDYAVYLFVFYRILRYQMAEILYKRKGLKLFLRMMGGIYVNRNTHDLSFLSESNEILNKGGVVGVFPESRIPKPEEERPLEFKQSVILLALYSKAPIIPVATNGSYFKKKRARVIIGTPFNAVEYYNETLSEKDNVANITKILRERIIELKGKLDGQEK